MTRQQTVEAKVELGLAVEASEVFGKKYKQFTVLVNDLKAVNELKKESEAESKRINGLLQELWADVEAKTVVDDGNKVTLVQNPGHASIKAELLIEQGVSVDVIKKATVMSNPFQYVLVTSPKVKG